MSVAPAHAAEPELTLPVSGLAIRLPPERAVAYAPSSGWVLGPDGEFSGGDTIDEVRDGKIVASTWVSVGWFEAGRCADVLVEAPIDEAWDAPAVALWGKRFAARGGRYAGAGVMRGRPVVTLCLERGPRRQLVLTRFAPEDRRTRPAQLGDLRASGVAQRIQRAFRDDHVATGARPAHGARNEGTLPAVREVSLMWAELHVTLPDDGYIWISGPGLDGLDRFERVAPALPELSLAVARVDNDPGEALACDDAFALVGGAASDPPIPGLPQGWVAGPAAHERERQSFSACRAFGWGLLVVGVVSAQRAPDFTPLAPLMAALGEAAPRPAPPRDMARTVSSATRFEGAALRTRLRW